MLCVGCGCGVCDCNGVSVPACVVSCLQFLPHRLCMVLLVEHLQLLQLRIRRAQEVKQNISLLVSEIKLAIIPMTSLVLGEYKLRKEIHQ